MKKLICIGLLFLGGCAVINPIGQTIERIDGTIGKLLTPHPKVINQK